MFEKASEFEQILNAEVGASGREGYKGIGREHIGPARRKSGHVSIVSLEVDALLIPGILEGEQVELASAEGVERMRDAETSRCTVAIRCNWQLW